MKYMTFNSSCSYCCLANLLEFCGVDVEDRDIALQMGLPYLFSRDEEDGAYQAGAMLQGKHWFDRYLNSIGYEFIEEFVPKFSASDLATNDAPCMMGLKTEFGKHAMIYTGQENGKYRFLNPHRIDDGQPDELLLTGDELMEALSDVNAIGRIERTGTIKAMDASDFERSLVCLRRCREDLHRFCGEHRTNGEVMAVVNSLFRPFAVDGLAMMELAGETGLTEELRLFQKDCMTLFRAGDCRPDEVVDMTRLDRIAEAYKVLIEKKLT